MTVYLDEKQATDSTRSLGRYKGLLGALAFACVAAGSAPTGVQRIECSERLGFWQESVRSTQSRYCRLVAHARINLEANPQRAQFFLNQAQVLIPEGDLVRFEVARGLLFNGEPLAAVTYLEEALGKPIKSINGSALLLGRIYAGVGQRRLSAAYYHEAIKTGALPGKGRARALVFLEAALLFSAFDNEGYEHPISLLERARAEDAPLLRPLFQPIEILIKRRLSAGGTSELMNEFRFINPHRNTSNTGGLEVTTEVSEFERLSWFFARLQPGRGKSSDLVPVLPPAERRALLSAAAESDGDHTLALSEHQAFLRELKELEAEHGTGALIKAPSAGLGSQ